MIFVRLAGGLGNQLYQIMAGLACAARTNRKLVPLTSSLSRYATARQPDALRLLSADRLLGADAAPGWVEWFGTRARPGLWMPHWGLNDRNFPSAIDQRRRWTCMDGYFQQGWNDSLLALAVGQVRLRPPAPAAARGADEADCLVHIRGGDFLQLDVHRVVDAGYYIRCAGQAVAQGCRSFAVVTDDPTHARQIVAQLTDAWPQTSWAVRPPAADALEDFAVLQQARQRIIGNSTFAWWASALGNPKATTWAPERFVRHTPRDYFLPTERVVSSTGNDTDARLRSTAA